MSNSVLTSGPNATHAYAVSVEMIPAMAFASRVIEAAAELSSAPAIYLAAMEHLAIRNGAALTGRGFLVAPAGVSPDARVNDVDFVVPGWVRLVERPVPGAAPTAPAGSNCIRVTPSHYSTSAELWLQKFNFNVAIPPALQLTEATGVTQASIVAVPPRWFADQVREYAHGRSLIFTDPSGDRLRRWVESHTRDKAAAYRSLGILTNNMRTFGANDAGY